ncbi:MAG: hypothetical protein JO126_02390 [Alphaproteobacteria bacterium]|nr:hypothetical protein [Alphaproteobacteria bacterium]
MSVHTKKILPEWLPKAVKKWAGKHAAELSKPNKDDVWKRIYRLLYSRDNELQQVWRWLEEQSADAPGAFMEEVFDQLHVSNQLRKADPQIRQMRELAKKAIPSLKKTRIHLQKMHELDGFSWYLPQIDALIQDLEAREGGYDYLENNICSSKNVFGLGRKEKTIKGQSISFTVRLARYMEDLGAPSLDMAAVVANTIFGTSYTGADVAGMRGSRKRKNIHP